MSEPSSDAPSQQETEPNTAPPGGKTNEGEGGTKDDATFPTIGGDGKENNEDVGDEESTNTDVKILPDSIVNSEANDTTGRKSAEENHSSSPMSASNTEGKDPNPDTSTTCGQGKEAANQKTSSEPTPGVHKVTFTVTIAKAIPTGEW